MDLVIPQRVEHYINASVCRCLGGYCKHMIEQKIKRNADSIKRDKSEDQISREREFKISITELQREVHEVVKKNRRTDEIDGETQSADCSVVTYGNYNVGQDRHEQPKQTMLDIGCDLLLAPSRADETKNHHYRKE